MKRILLAYSRSLDAADAIPWLADRYSAEVVTLTLDFGQGRVLEALRDCALAAGASRAHVLDVAAAFASEFTVPALRAGALYTNGKAAIKALGRMAVAQKLVEVAAIEQTTTVAHGGGTDDRSMAAAVHALDARLNAIAVPSAAADLEIGRRFVASGETPSEPAYVELAFVRGIPSAINGIAMPLFDLIRSVDMLAAAHRVGRFDGLETPGVAVMHAAHHGLQERVAPDTTERQALRRQYADLLQAGGWFSAGRRSLDEAIAELEEPVSGDVRAQLSRGECRIIEIKPMDTIIGGVRLQTDLQRSG